MALDGLMHCIALKAGRFIGPGGISGAVSVCKQDYCSSESNRYFSCNSIGWVHPSRQKRNHCIWCPSFNRSSIHGNSATCFHRCMNISASQKGFIIEAVATDSWDRQVSEEFADEEDFLKAGGTELRYAQMQATKPMEQPKITDKLQPLQLGDVDVDLVVIGCGPAGLSLAAESAKQGLNVGLIGPDLPFTNNYGVWEDEFEALGLENCIEHVWRDTAVYLESDDPFLIGRAYGRVGRDLLREELLTRCQKAGVLYLNSKVKEIIETSETGSLVSCENGMAISCRLVTVASGAASGKFLQYEIGGPRFSAQTAYGIEVEVEHIPYNPELMVFMDYRDYMSKRMTNCDFELPTFLYAMPLSSTRVFFEETCLASRPAMPFEQLKKRLQTRLKCMGVQVLHLYEEEWSYIPVGGSLPNTRQKHLAFGAAASMVHPATGYSVVRSLSEAPSYAAAIASALMHGTCSGALISYQRSAKDAGLRAWETLWPQERKRQRAFFIFGLELILQLNIDGTRMFFETFFRLPEWMWKGFLGASLSSVELIWFAFIMFITAPNYMRYCLVKHLMSDPSGAKLVQTYLGL